MNENVVRIPIVYATDNKYVMPTIVSMESAVRNMDDASFYEFTILVPGNFEQENRDRFEKFKNIHKNTCSVNIYNMQDLYYNSKLGSVKSFAVYYRLVIPWVLKDKDKVIYLDGDTLVRHDLQPMLHIDLGDNYVGACIDYFYDRHIVFDGKCYRPDKYVCAGVLLMNCKLMRNDKLDEKFDYIEKKQENFIYCDQDILNVACFSRIKILPFEFGSRIFPKRWKQINTSEEEWKKGISDATIMHFSGPHKPWLLERREPYLLWGEWKNIFLDIRDVYDFDDLNLSKNYATYFIKKKIIEYKNLLVTILVCLMFLTGFIIIKKRRKS